MSGDGIIGTPRLGGGEISAELPVNLSDASFSGRITIGAFTYFNYGCEVAEAEIGRYCSIGQRVIIAPGEHQIAFLSTHPFVGDRSGISSGFVGNPAYAGIAATAVDGPLRIKPGVVIGNDVWVGARCTILRGARIGHGAIVAAGSVVSGKVAPYAIVGGVPARHIRWRFPWRLRRRLLKLEWWNYDLAKLGLDRDYSEIEKIVGRLTDMKKSGELGWFAPERVVRRA